jgi:hypothetical protein
MTKKLLVFIIVMGLLIPSLSTAENGIAVDDGKNSGVWKQPSGTILRNSEKLIRSLQTLDSLGNIWEIRLDGVTTTTSGNLISLHNLRATSDTTDFDDYISVDFLMDMESLRLLPITVDISPNLGVYYRDEALFSKDVPRDIFMTTSGGNTLEPDELYTITAEPEHEPTMYLEAGTVVAMKIVKPSDDFELQIESPDGKAWKNLYRANSSWTLTNRSILKSGDYKFRFVPQNDSSVTLQFGFTNNNRTSLRDVILGDRISASLNGWGYEYAKYRLELNAGDLLEVSAPSDDDINLYLVDSNSRSVSHTSRGEMFVRVSRDGSYYLFVVNGDYSSGSSYSGTVRITADSDLRRYPVLATVPEQSVNKGEFFFLQLAASNAPTKFYASGLPTDISVDETSGLISGTPTISGTFPIRVAAENEFGSDRKDFFLTVREETGTACGKVPPSENGGYFATSELWIRGIINTDDGPIDGVFYKGGENRTSRGDTVVWGYFYADPSDVSWGDKANPDLYVKIWFDVSGRIDVNFFHVSVPDIDVYSDYQYDGSYDKRGAATMDNRYVRHEYWKR